MLRILLVAVAAVALLGAVACGGPSEAQQWSENVHVTLDVTTDAGVFAQMPKDMAPEMELNASGQRVETWTFDDGSQMVFAYVTGAAGDGLVLNWIDLKD